MKKQTECWYCHTHGFNILDKAGCCKRCGTNLKKYPTRESHPYPDLGFEHEKEVLGDTQPFKYMED